MMNTHTRSIHTRLQLRQLRALQSESKSESKRKGTDAALTRHMMTIPHKLSTITLDFDLEGKRTSKQFFLILLC